MKPGKKTWIWGAVSIALIVILTWTFLPEYGSGYSEKQRRNWNGMIALSPTSDRQARSFLLEKMEELASEEASEWKLDIPESFGKLPLEGLPIPFLKKLAEEGKGNGDASLELAFRAEFDNTFDSSADFSFPSLESVYQLETYLNKAVKQGRAGAGFLCRLFDYRKKGGDDEGVRNLDGYRSFLSRMDDGDFALGKVYLYLDPNGDEALSRLAEGLRKKADCGDVAALRDSAYLSLLRWCRCGHDHLRQGIVFRNIMENGLVRSSIRDFHGMLQKWMPNSSSLLDKSEEVMIDWLKEFDLARALRRMEGPLELLSEAAEKGDIHAKYLWVKYSETIKSYFSKGDWERHLKYVDDLLKVGGIYSDILYEGDCFSNMVNNKLPFYKSECQDRMIHDSDERFEREYTLLFPDAEGFEILRMNVKASIRMKDFVEYLDRPKLSEDDEMDKNQQAAIQLLENAAEKGDPFAMFYLSKILCDDGVKEGDALRAWELLNVLEKWLENVRGLVRIDIISYNERTENGSKWWGMSIEKAVRIQEVDIVSRHGDMPGMTVKEAFEQFLEDSAKRRYVGKQEETLKAQFEKRGFKIPEDKK